MLVKHYITLSSAH